MKSEINRLRFPIKGVAFSTALTQQPPLTSPAAVNARSFDADEDCTRGGQRHGVSKWHAAQVADSDNPVQDINILVERS